MHIYINTYIYRCIYTAQPPFKISCDGAVVQACRVEVVFLKPANDPCLRGT